MCCMMVANVIRSGANTDVALKDCASQGTACGTATHVNLLAGVRHRHMQMGQTTHQA